MIVRRNHKLAILGVAVLAPLMFAGAAQADDGPSHQGDPKRWGPPLAALCDNPAAAAAAGYNVILGNNANNVIIGTPMADAIYAFAGNDTVRGGPGPDVLCLGDDKDRGNGGSGNDAVFGEGHDDQLRGATGRDYLDGGPHVEGDKCDGGPQLDAAVACETVINVP